ncbi:MAG: rod-binding protein, partial [Deltaproteobacteria bacterium]|nr:rod-binding protein [Deltaproteobacteria bacterium]
MIGQSADKRTKDEGLKAACAEFESLFIYQLLKMMRGAVPKTPLFHGGPGEDIYTSMFDQEVARKMAED